MESCLITKHLARIGLHNSAALALHTCSVLCRLKCVLTMIVGIDMILGLSSAVDLND